MSVAFHFRWNVLLGPSIHFQRAPAQLVFEASPLRLPCSPAPEPVLPFLRFHCEELFRRVEIVATLEADNRAVVQFCNKRATAEQWMAHISSTNDRSSHDS